MTKDVEMFKGRNSKGKSWSD